MDQKRQPALRTVVVLFILGFNIFAGLMLSPFLCGMIASEIVLIAIWGAFASATLFWRLTMSIFALYSASCCLLIGMSAPLGIVENNLTFEFAIYFFAVCFSAFAAIFIVLEILRNTLRISIASIDAEQLKIERGRTQFDLHRLFLITTFVPVIILLFKLVFPKETEQYLIDIYLEDSVLAAIKIFLLIPVSIGMVRVILFRDPMSLKASCAWIGASVGVMLVVEWLLVFKKVFSSLTGIRPYPLIDSLQFDFGFCVTLACALLVARSSGSKLIRQGSFGGGNAGHVMEYEESDNENKRGN
jgi:hypothetical protein